MTTTPGVYILRTNIRDRDEEALWGTYTSLTEVKAVFRSLKSELGLRPIDHHKESRAEAHMIISVLAYQAVQLLRRRLKDAGYSERWKKL